MNSRVVRALSYAQVPRFDFFSRKPGELKLGNDYDTTKSQKSMATDKD